MQDAYSALVLAETPTVLGKRLCPFSLGHAHVLEAVGSPFLRGSNPTAGDLVLAVLICSRVAFGPDRFTVKMGAELVAECEAWGKEQASANFAEEMDKFRKYVQAHTNAPKRWDKGSGGALRIPWTLALFWRVSGGKVCESMERHLWNMPLPFVIAYSAAAAAFAGDDSYVSDEEIEAAAKLRAMEAAEPKAET